MARVCIIPVSLRIFLLIQIAHCATYFSPDTDFSGSGGSFINGGRFQGSASKAGRFSGSSTFIPTPDDPFGERQGSNSRSGPSRRDTSASFGPGSDRSMDMNGLDHDFGTSGSSSSSRGQPDRTDRDRSSSSDRDRSSSSSDRDRLSGSSFSSRNRNSDIDRPSRTGSTERPVEDTLFGQGSSGVDHGQVRNPSDRPECTDCRIRGLPTPIVETTTSKSFLSKLFGRR
ncbi:hypothetical protein RvY_16731-1 [Ramazzottius varieornatus]|uniref:Uncharacterized protein n=1 Tax=Ramazzottius varieornatus TaxID=947166 RepID=A0A1D1W5U3_RAMVA|nr:hypothetical protein RvY_16731-1 [Ramazzottius varieornatus]